MSPFIVPGSSPLRCGWHLEGAPPPKRKKGKMAKDKSARRRIGAVETAVTSIQASVASIPHAMATAVQTAFDRERTEREADVRRLNDRVNDEGRRRRNLGGFVGGGLGLLAIVVAIVLSLMGGRVGRNADNIGDNATAITAVNDRIDGVVTSIADLRADFERFTLDFGPRVGALETDIAGTDQEIADLREWLSDELGYIRGDIQRFYDTLDARLLVVEGRAEPMTTDEFRLMVLGVLAECGIPCRVCEIPPSTVPYAPPTTRGGGGSTTSTTQASTTTTVAPSTTTTTVAPTSTTTTTSTTVPSTTSTTSTTTTEPTTTTTLNVGPEIISISATLGETNCEGFAEVVFGASVSDPDGVRSVVFSLANGSYYLGWHTVTVTATDNLGASTSRPYRFNVPEVENPAACGSQPTIPTETTTSTTEGGGNQPTIPTTIP
ncbi:hypothetical protein KKH05_02655 [Patescibacteria group bacterium]|nr:hypothetical protein [Patescibacteria group bacterium]